MTQNRIRTALMDSAIKVVARDGLDKVTTRSIATECNLHDTYIYRYFIDKEDLLKRTFLREDKRLNDKIIEKLHEVGTENKTFKELMKSVLMPIWDYLMDNEDICKFYVRYYYSEYFVKDAMADFKADFIRLESAFAHVMPSGKDSEMIFQHNLDTMLSMAIKVTTGQIAKSDDIDERVFNLLYSITKVFLEIEEE